MVQRDADPYLPRSQLFTIRLWMEPVGDGRLEWRGRVQHVPSGQWETLRDWPTLVQFLEQVLQQLNKGEDS